jgi:hypothetical protein
MATIHVSHVKEEEGDIEKSNWSTFVKTLACDGTRYNDVVEALLPVVVMDEWPDEIMISTKNHGTFYIKVEEEN